MRAALLCTLLLAAPALAQTTVNSNCTSGAGWATTPGNAAQGTNYTADGAYAITAVTGQPFLTVSTCAMSIPAGATINGIQVRIVGCGNGTSGQRTLNVNVAGLGTCTAKTTTQTACATNSDVTLGTTADLWSCTSVSQANVNATTFGATVQTNTSQSQTQQVDLIELSVTYTGGAAGGAAGPDPFWWQG